MMESLLSQVPVVHLSILNLSLFSCNWQPGRSRDVASEEDLEDCVCCFREDSTAL